jgi:RNA polymerase sigma factor (sigma-70 family)
MSLVDEFRSLRRMTEHLPFAVDDYDQANDAFVRLRAGDESLRDVVDLFAYLYTRRYFLTKFIRNRDLPPTDCDTLVGDAYGRFRRKAATIEQADRFTAWLSVVCANLFRNYISRRKPLSNLDGEALARIEGDGIDTEAVDQGVLATLLLGAILRLPDFLQEVARMRLVEEMSYADMAEATGKPEATLRSYVNKVLTRLRQDSAIRDLDR